MIAISAGWQSTEPSESLWRPQFLDAHVVHETIEGVVLSGMIEFLILIAERGNHVHRVALIYSSATDNRVYKQLAEQVERIYFNGQPYMLDQFAHGVSVPVCSADDFRPTLDEWNASSAEGKFAPTTSTADRVPPSRSEHRFILAEEPIKAVWLRIRQLHSVTLAKKLIMARLEDAGVSLTQDEVDRKAEGVSYAARNAYDYFLARDASPVSQRVLNLYYGSLAFASAEMLAAPTGSKTLEEIENYTKYGHGLYTIDGVDTALGSLVVGVISSGFFPAWMRSMGMATAGVPQKKPREYADLAPMPQTSWVTVEALFAHIPEMADLFIEIFDSKPAWIAPHYDALANHRGGMFGTQQQPARTYGDFIDVSGRLTREDVAEFPGPLSEITPIEPKGSEHRFRVAVDHPGETVWWNAMPLHRSPFVPAAIIKPIFGVIDEYRAMCVILLYALSIIVRYRPSIWRRVQEGDLDQVRILIEAFLAIVERILPHEFLEKITGQRVIVKEPGSFY
jgi:hypothetical protein